MSARSRLGQAGTSCSVPSIFITQMRLPPPRVDTNASSRPFGEMAGIESSAGSVVSGRRAPLAGSRLHRSMLPAVRALKTT